MVRLWVRRDFGCYDFERWGLEAYMKQGLYFLYPQKDTRYILTNIKKEPYIHSPKIEIYTLLHIPQEDRSPEAPVGCDFLLSLVPRPCVFKAGSASQVIAHPALYTHTYILSHYTQSTFFPYTNNYTYELQTSGEEG